MIRVLGNADKSAAEPGYVSERINFFAVRDQLDWSLPVAWKLNGARGETPIIPRRHLDFTDHATSREQLDIQGVTHLLTGRKRRGALPVRSRPVGAAFIHRNDHALPRVRMAGKPLYAKDVAEATALIDRLTKIERLRQHVIVEDPTRPLPADAVVTGSARIVEEVPERLVVETEAAAPGYLVVADSFDPGWSATVDGQARDDLPGLLCIPCGLSFPGEARRRFRLQPGRLQARARDQPLRCSCRTRVLVLAETIDSARQ